MKITNQFGLPEAFLSFARRDKYDAGNADISVTTLIDAPRVNILKQQKANEVTVDVVDMIWPLLGTAVHSILDQAEAKGNVITEERLFAKFRGWTVSGQIDHQEEHESLIYVSDYKVTSVWSVIYGKSAWDEQLNCYAHLIRKAKDRKVGGLRIVAVLRDWQRREAENKSDYPQSPVVNVDIPLWDPEKAEAFMNERVHMHQEAQMVWDTKEAIVQCSDEERWTKPTRWAAVKKGNKRAAKVFDSKDEAMAWITSQPPPYAFVIVERAGERTRCEKYCSVADFCTQWALERVTAAAPEFFGEN